jgi:hypothetical protein
MAVTKQTYTVTATWTASQLADIFKSAFIDAGLMADWHDSFLSGAIENRILEVTYDATKTYGKTYYWWMFSTAGAFVHVATGWDTATDVPTGTQYLDFFATTTNSANNHLQLININTANTAELVRYTSGIDANDSWFVFKSAALKYTFSILNDAKTIQPWVDLDKGFFPGFSRSFTSTATNMGNLAFTMGPSLRREAIRGCALVGNTLSTSYTSSAADQIMIGYKAIGHLSNAVGNLTALGRESTFLPVGFSSTNPAYTTNSNPVFHSLTWNPYITTTFPADFGITLHYATNSFSLGDTFVVTAGVEEWEVLDFAAAGSAVTGASPLFLARMV